MRCRSSRSHMFCKIGVPKYFGKFTRKRLYQRPATLLKRDSDTGVFLWILRRFKSNFFTAFLLLEMSCRIFCCNLNRLPCCNNNKVKRISGDRGYCSYYYQPSSILSDWNVFADKVKIEMYLCFYWSNNCGDFFRFEENRQGE